MSEALLSLSAVNLVLGDKTLLEDINLQLSAGEIVTVVGPNGAGKTTLLRVARANGL